MKLLCSLICIACTTATIHCMDEETPRKPSVLGDWITAAFNTSKNTSSQKNMGKIFARIRTLEKDDTLNLLSKHRELAQLYTDLATTYQVESQKYREYIANAAVHTQATSMLEEAEKAKQQLEEEMKRQRTINFLMQELKTVRTLTHERKMDHYRETLDVMDKIIPLLTPNSTQYHELKAQIEEAEKCMQIECFKERLAKLEENKEKPEIIVRAYHRFLRQGLVSEEEWNKYKAQCNFWEHKMRTEEFLQHNLTEYKETESRPYINDFYKYDALAGVLQKKRDFLSNHQDEYGAELQKCTKDLTRIRSHQLTLTQDPHVQQRLLASLK